MTYVSRQIHEHNENGKGFHNIALGISYQEHWYKLLSYVIINPTLSMSAKQHKI